MPRNLADVQRELQETLRKIQHAKDREAALKLVEKLRRLLKGSKVPKRRRGLAMRTRVYVSTPPHRHT